MGSVQDFLTAINNLLSSGRQQEARAHLERAVNLNPEHATLIATLGRVLWSIGEIKEAEARFNKAIELEPENINNQLNMAEFMLAQKRVNEGHDYAAKAVELAPTYAPAKLIFAQLKHLMDQDDKAVLILKSIDPQSLTTPQDLMLGGILLTQLGIDDLGDNFLDRAKSAFRNDEDYMMILATMSENAGHLELAKLCLADLIRKFPDRDDLKEKLSKLSDDNSDDKGLAD